MERIGYSLEHGYIYKRQNERGTLIYLRCIGWIRKPA